MMKNTVLGDRLQQAKPKRHGRVSRSGVGPPTKACRGYCRGYPSVKHTIEPALYLVESNPPLLRRISGHHKAIPCGSLCEHQTGRTHLALFGRHFWLPCFKLLYSIRCAAMAEFLGADASDGSGSFRTEGVRDGPGVLVWGLAYLTSPMTIYYLYYYLWGTQFYRHDFCRTGPGQGVGCCVSSSICPLSREIETKKKLAGG